MDSTDPFFLHPFDSPGMTLVNTFFDGHGFAGSERALLIALSAKNKLGFLVTRGPYKSSTHDGYKYFLIIVDDCNRCTWTYLLSTKSNDFSRFMYIPTYFPQRVCSRKFFL